jgi:MFS family permease
VSLDHEKATAPGGGNRVLGTARRGVRRRHGAPGGRLSTPRLALILIATAQFVLVLDITIVTVALPTIQRELGFQQAELQWLITGYALTFGGYLLVAGRAADLSGRRRLFVLGVLLFGAASLAAGLSVNKVMLVVARAGQGLAVPLSRRPRWRS